MQANGELLITLLKRLKNARSADNNGILHPISVIGASMGGQVAKYALAKMEKESPNDFCTNNYIAFDSPHKGANISISIQAMLEMLHRAGKSDRWETALLRPAARQLLYNHLANNAQLTINNWGTVPVSPAVNNTVPPTFNHREDWLNTLASYGNYPTKSRKTAIACGNINAVPLPWKNDTDNKMFGMQIFSNGKKLPSPQPFGYVGQMHLFSTETSKNNAHVGYINTLNPPYVSINNFDTHGCCGEGNILFAGAIPGSFANVLGNDIPIAYHSSIIRTKAGVNLANWDAAPGCTRNDLIDTEAEFRGQFPTGGDPELTIFKNVKDFTFMPTVSALDINWTMDNANMYKNIFDAKIIQNKLTPFEAFYAPATANLRHVEITKEMKDTLVAWITENERDLVSLPNSKGANYNFGFAKRWIPSVSINNGGTLRINNEGATAYGGGKSSYDAEYDTYLFDCGSATLNVNTGGKLILGSDNSSKSGIIKVANSSNLVLAGGVVKLQKNSKLIIEQGGKAYFNAGTIDLRDNSKIIVQSGGQLAIKSTAQINLFNNSQIIVELGGKLILESPNTITFNGDGTGTPVIIYGELVAKTPVKMLNDAYFRFEKGNTVTVPQGGTLSIQGSAQTTRMIEIVADAKIALTQRSIDFKQGKINYFQNAKIELKNADQVRFYNINAEEIGKTTHSARALLLDAPNIVSLNNSNFTKFYAAVEAKKQTQGYVRATSCAFVFNRYGINAIEVNYVNVSSSTFTQNQIGLAGSNTASYYVNASTFVDNDYGMDLLNTFASSYLQVGNSQIRENHFVGVRLKSIPYAIFTNTLIENHNRDFANALFGQLEQTTNPYDYDFSCYENSVPNFDSECRGVSATNDCNIIMQEGTVVRSNSIGVFSEGSSNNNSSISLDCATFDDNGAGIKGLYTEILADVYSVVPHTSNFTRPNNFILGNGLYLFDMGYYFKNLPKSAILLTGNYWNAKNQGLSPDPSTMNFFSQAAGLLNVECEHCQKFGNCLPYITEPEATDFNGDCKLFGLIGSDDSGAMFKTDFSTTFAPECNCEQMIEAGYQGVPTSVHAQFRAAYYAMRADDFNMERVLEAFTQIAQLPIIENGEGGKLCEQYIRYARAIVDIYPDENGHFGAKIQKTPTSSIRIYPNPATERINITMPKGNFDISIMDNQGRNVLKMNSESETTINTNNWLSGIYHVSLRNTATGEQEVQKVVVMKMD